MWSDMHSRPGQKLPVAMPVMGQAMDRDSSAGVGQPDHKLTADQVDHSGVAEQSPEVDACGKFLLWMATLLSCCTITDWSQATKAHMWRSRVSLMLIYLVVLIVTGITMFACYGGYQKLTVLDDQGQRTMLLFGDSDIRELLAWNPLSSCGDDSEGLTMFTNHSTLGLFNGFGPKGCITAAVVVSSSASVVFEDITDRTVTSLQVNETRAVEYMCADGMYAVRVTSAEGSTAPPHEVLVYNSPSSVPIVVNQTASPRDSLTVLAIRDGVAEVVSQPDCARLSIEEAPADAIWEVAHVRDGKPIASGIGPSSSPTLLCTHLVASSYVIRMYDTRGRMLLPQPETSCRMTAAPGNGGAPLASFTCGGGGVVSDVALLYVSPSTSPEFVASSSAAECSSLSVSYSAGDQSQEWWLISPAGTWVSSGTSSATQIRLCESGLYEFGLAGAGATAWLEHSRASEQLRATVTGDGESAAALFEAGAAGRGFVYPEGRCLRANMEFEDSSDPEDTTWQLQMPVRFPPLMSAAASWRLPPLTEGSKSTPLDRYLCQRGAYTVTVSAQRDGDSYGNFALAFNGNASALPSCSQSYCVYHGCSSSSGGGFFASLQDNADQAWEGLGNEEGSLAIDITGGDSGDQPVNCGYSSNLNGKEPPEGGKPAQDVVHFLKREGSAEGVLVPGEPQHWELSYEDGTEEEEVLMFCKPVQCPETPPPAPPAPASPPPPPGATQSSTTGTGFFAGDSSLGSALLDGGSSRQCHPLICPSPGGEDLEYQCWEAVIDNTGLMSIMTMVALVVCPLGWFIIKLMGIKAEAYLNDQKEAEENDQGCCQFPCCFCCTFCGCTCGTGTLKVIKFCLTFGANSVLAINLAFAYDPEGNHYFADIFAATTWLAYMTIALMLVNTCWGLCNWRDMFKSREELLEEDRKTGGDLGWTAGMCCQLILGCFVLGAVCVGIFVWGASAVAELGVYAYSLDGITAEALGAALKKMAMGIALIHPDLLQLPQLTPIPLQISLSITICLGPLIILLDLIAQLPLTLLAGFCGLGSRMTQVVPLASGEGVSKADVAEKLSAAQAKVGGKLDAKDEAAAKRQAGNGLDAQIDGYIEAAQGKIDAVQSRVEQVQGVLDGVSTFQSHGVQGLLEETTAVQALQDPMQYGEERLVGQVNAAVDKQTFGRLDKMDEEDEERQAAAAARRNEARGRQAG